MKTKQALEFHIAFFEGLEPYAVTVFDAPHLGGFLVYNHTTKKAAEVTYAKAVMILADSPGKVAWKEARDG